MKGDFSRSSFDKSKHYHKVKIQQGRVQVDADWNEQVDIQSYHNIISLSDIIGQSGTSTKDAFNIQAQGATYTVGKGRYYIGGLVAENDEFISDGITWQQERHLPSIEGVLPEQKSVRGLVSPKDDGFYIAFLEVWEHPLTALEDPEIREPALGGPRHFNASKDSVAGKTPLCWREFPPNHRRCRKYFKSLLCPWLG